MRALLLIDIQNDFLPGGALAVSKGDEVIPVANKLIDDGEFDFIVATQDFHPSNHGSFASNNGRKVGEMAKLGGLDQVMWPNHCVQGTSGAEFADDLKVESIQKIFQKGMDPQIDSYSGFFDNGKKKSTGLGEFLKNSGISEVVVLGLATDYCVKFTVLDALSLGFKTKLIVDGSRAVNLHPGDEKKSIEEMIKAGAQVLTSDQFLRGKAS